MSLSLPVTLRSFNLATSQLAAPGKFLRAHYRMPVSKSPGNPLPCSVTVLKWPGLPPLQIYCKWTERVHGYSLSTSSKSQRALRPHSAWTWTSEESCPECSLVVQVRSFLIFSSPERSQGMRLPASAAYYSQHLFALLKDPRDDYSLEALFQFRGERSHPTVLSKQRDTITLIPDSLSTWLRPESRTESDSISNPN